MKKELCLMSALLILCSAYSGVNAAEKAAPAAAPAAVAPPPGSPVASPFLNPAAKDAAKDANIAELERQLALSLIIHGIKEGSVMPVLTAKDAEIARLHDVINGLIASGCKDDWNDWTLAVQTARKAL